MWAGLVYKLDTTMLIWALQNVRSNNFTIMSYLLAKADLRDADEHKFRCELAAERDKADWKADQDRLVFLDAIESRLEVHQSGK
jgi:hypothetical protein